MAGDNRRAENPVSPFLDVDLHEADFLTVGDRTMHVMHRYGEGSHRDILIARLANVKADVRDLGIGVGAPWDRQRAEPPPAERQRVVHGDARGSVGGVSELVL